MSVRIARRGSIAAARVTASAVNTLSLDGTSGNYASTPSAAANQITGDIDIRVKLSMSSWDGTNDQMLLAKYGAFGSRSYGFGRNTSGKLYFLWYDSGDNFVQAPATAATGFTNGTAHWVRVAFDVNPGTMTFYTSEDGSSWTILGSAVSTGVTTIKSTSQILEVGSFAGGVGGRLIGNVYRAELRSGIGGSIVQVFDATAVTKLGTRNPSSVVASTGETWTLNGSAWDWVSV